MDTNERPDEELRRMAGNESPFSAPEGYFEKFPGRITDSLSGQKKSIPVWARWMIPAGSLAAVLVLGVLFLMPSDHVGRIAETTLPVAAADQNLMFGLNEHELAESLDPGEELDTEVAAGLDDELIAEYLLNENVELSLILNESSHE